MVAGVVAVLAASQIVFAADRTPSTYGEIYSVTASGKVTNLSRSPAADTFPAGSPDGKHVAFVSVRGGRARIFVVGSDGKGLHTVSPPLARVRPHDGVVATIAWAPDSRRLGVQLSVDAARPALYVTSIAGGWHAVAHGLVGRPVAWSRDGTRLAFATAAGLVQVIDASGRKLWSLGGEGTPAWSRDSRLAVSQNSTTVGLYDVHGRSLATFAGSAFAWSPSGAVLATDRAGTLELRPGGVGRPTTSIRLDPRARADDLARVEWVNATHIRLFDNRSFGYDVAQRRVWKLPKGADAFDSVVSAQGMTAYTASGAQAVRLVRGSRVLASIPTCHDDPAFDGVQFLGGTNNLVYQSGCPVPSADLYSIAPDGSAFERLTTTPQHELSPALSPDGSRVAFVQQPVAAFCDGCAQSIWLTPSTQLTFPQESDEAPFDEDPSWSPDGVTIVYSNSGPDTPFSLFTIAAAGGTPLPLGIQGERPAWGPKLIAFEVDGTPPKLETYDPATHTVTVVATANGRDPMALAWSRDGRLAYLASTGSKHVIAIVGGGVFTVPRPAATGLAWSPDGTRFAFVAADANGNGEVYTIGVDGKALQQVTHNLGVVGNLSWR
jgi:Tol biopolymer transport system component